MNTKQKILAWSALLGILLVLVITLTNKRAGPIGTTQAITPMPSIVAQAQPTATLPSPTVPLTSPFRPDSSTGWCWQDVMGLVNSLNDVFFLDDRIGWAVGDRGTILHTDNGGDTWQRQTSPVIADLHRVVFADPQAGWTVGTYWDSTKIQAVLLRTFNGGRTWTKLALPQDAGGLDMAWPDSYTGWLIAGGRVFHTVDSGQTWQEQSLPREYTWLNSIASIDRQHVWIVADKAILRTTDGSVTWTASTFDQDLYLTTIIFVDTQTGWSFGEYGAIVRFVDGGQTWQTLEAKMNEPPQGVIFLDTQTGWVQGTSRLWHTTDGGVTWMEQNASLYRRAITFVDAQHGWTVGGLSWLDGERTTIERTGDGGATWQVQDLHIEMPPLAYAAAANLTALLSQPDPPLEVMLARLFQGPCIYKEREWMEIALRNLGWDGANWGEPLAKPDDALIYDIHQQVADLDGDGQDEIVLYSDSGELFAGVLDWDGIQWQVAWHTDRTPLSHGGEIQVRVEDFNGDKRQELLIEEMLCGHTGCMRNVSLVGCRHLGCQYIWSKETGAALGGFYENTLFEGWSGGDYNFENLGQEIRVRHYGMSYNLGTDNSGQALPGTLRAQVPTATQTIDRWDGTRYTPTTEIVLEPGYVLDTRPVSNTLDLNGDGIVEQVVYGWQADRWSLQQTLSIYVPDGREAWHLTQVLTATVVEPSAEISLQDMDNDKQFEIVKCDSLLPFPIGLATWPFETQPTCTIYHWDSATYTFEPRP